MSSLVAWFRESTRRPSVTLGHADSVSFRRAATPRSLSEKSGQLFRVAFLPCTPQHAARESLEFRKSAWTERQLHSILSVPRRVREPPKDLFGPSAMLLTLLDDVSADRGRRRRAATARAGSGRPPPRRSR